MIGRFRGGQKGWFKAALFGYQPESPGERGAGLRPGVCVSSGSVWSGFVEPPELPSPAAPRPRPLRHLALAAPEGDTG